MDVGRHLLPNSQVVIVDVSRILARPARRGRTLCPHKIARALKTAETHRRERAMFGAILGAIRMTGNRSA